MTAVIERFDIHQKRDPNGEWGDGVSGSGLPDFDLEGFDLVSDIDGSFGNAVMAVDPGGDVRLAFREGAHNRELDLSGDDFHELGDVLQRLVDSRDDIADDAESGEVQDEYGFGDGHRAELYGNGVISVVLGADDPDPWTLNLDPPDGEDDDAQTFLDAMDDVFNEVDAERSRAGGRSVSDLGAPIERRFNKDQDRDPNGEWGDGVPGPSTSTLKDALKLAGKIDLAPNEKLIGSAKVDTDMSGIRMALIERDGDRLLRFGVGGEGYGQRDREAGIKAWDGDPSPPPLSAADRKRLNDEDDALIEEDDTASPARQAEIEARRQDIHEALATDDIGFNGTTELDEHAQRRLADRIRPLLAEAVEQEKAENKAWDEIEALEAAGNPDPERMAALRKIVDRGGSPSDAIGIEFGSGIVPGAWGDAHFSVELDDLSMGPYVLLGVQPKNTPADWGAGKDWKGSFDPAETRKFLRLLDQYVASTTAQRAYSQEQGGAPAAPAGGQFALGGGRVGAKGKKQSQPRRKRPAKAAGPSRPSAPAGPLSFDGQHGTGYGIKGGDPRVRTLQSALNRLGLADSSGATLVLDGKYGPRTTSAVKKLQKSLGLTADGKVTPELLKQATELKQLPPKTATPRKPRAKKPTSPAKRSRILAQVARALGECFLVDGVCVTCAPSLDEASRALLDAFEEIERVRHVRTAAGVKKYGLPIGSLIGGSSSPGLHVPDAPRMPAATGKAAEATLRPVVKADPRAPRSSFRDRLVTSIDNHLKGGGSGDPFDGYSREQLRQVAKARGIKLDRGEDRESIGKKLLDDLGGNPKTETPKVEEPKPAKKALAKRAPRKKAEPKTPAKPSAGLVKGRDLVANGGDRELSRQVDADAGNYTSADTQLASIAAKQGFDGPPRVVSRSEMDRLTRDREPLYRGTHSSNGMSAAAMNEQLRTGPAWFGNGIFGNGFYFAVDEEKTRFYSDRTPGSMMRAVLDPEANIVSLDDLKKLLRDYDRKMEDDDPRWPVFSDPGRLAAALGYDAVRVPMSQGEGGDQVLVLNRTALIIEEAG